MSDLKTSALQYHAQPVPGKISTVSSKPCSTQQELALAYTPGVASPCLEIKANPADVYKYTVKGNYVAVVSDGTAVLGLGNIGPEAGLPVMEGKCVLFKRFADIDAVPLCLGKVFNSEGKTDADRLIAAVEALEPSFGGINLEDIAAPACFRVEQELKQRMGIPVFHDDQHGTAIISLAALLNAAEITGRRLCDLKVAASGAGAAGLSCLKFYVKAGVKRENITVCDINGVITRNNARNPEQLFFATERNDVHTLAEAMRGADVFLGCSAGNLVDEPMIRSMAPNPIVFAMANPTPEIMPERAVAAGAAVVGTGRTDFVNQINNVLGFPGIFRGALDCRARDITDGMQLAAAHALASLAKREVTGTVREQLVRAYPADARNGIFDGACPLKPSYVIPKPFDPRVVPHIARHVIAAAMAEGVARLPVDNLDRYEEETARRIAAVCGQ